MQQNAIIMKYNYRHFSFNVVWTSNNTNESNGKQPRTHDIWEGSQEDQQIWKKKCIVFLSSVPLNTLIYFSKKMAKIVSSLNGTKFHQIWMISTMEGFTRSEKLVKGHKGYSTSHVWEKKWIFIIFSTDYDYLGLKIHAVPLVWQKMSIKAKKVTTRPDHRKLQAGSSTVPNLVF